MPTTVIEAEQAQPHQRVPKKDYKPEASALMEKFRPIWDQERAEEVLFQKKISPILFAEADLLAFELADKSVQEIDGVFSYMAQWTNLGKATLELRRKVGEVYPKGKREPEVGFTVYAELIKANAEDRDRIFAGHIDPVNPADWTADAMRAAVRNFYMREGAPSGAQKKTVHIKGFGRIEVVRLGTEVQITLPHSLEVQTIRAIDSTILKMDYEGDEEDAV